MKRESVVWMIDLITIAVLAFVLVLSNSIWWFKYGRLRQMAAQDQFMLRQALSWMEHSVHVPDGHCLYDETDGNMTCSDVVLRTKR